MDSLTKFRECPRQYNVMNSHTFRNNKCGTAASERYLAARKPSGLLHNGKHTHYKEKVNFQEFTQCSAVQSI